MLTCKFGGSSLSCSANFQRAAAILAADSHRHCVVVSAPGRRNPQDEKLTDLLYACQSAAAQGRGFSALFDRVAGRYLEIAQGLGLRDIGPLLDEARAALRHASPARAASLGERLCAQLMARYLNWPFVDAAEVVRFGPGGALDASATQALLAGRLRSLPCAVLPGFYGAAANGEIFTFSRGGGDITGALAAQAVNAEVYENWTDVPGVLRADPRIIPEAAPVPFLTYRELKLLSRLGAGVVHAQAIAPAHRAGIPTHVRSTFAPDAPGTVIADTLPAGQARGYLIAGRGDLQLITCRLPLEADAPRHVPDLLPAPLAAILSPGEIRMAVPADAFLPTLSHAASTAPCAALGVIGPDSPGLAARVLDILFSLGAQPAMLCREESALLLILPPDSWQRAARALYDALIRS